MISKTLTPKHKLNQFPQLPQQGQTLCRFCQFYQFQGRNGGYCHRLGVPVCSHWHSCHFMKPAFGISREEMAETDFR